MATYKLHKGYVPTKDKRCLMSFKGRGSDELYTYEQVCNLPEYAGILADNTVLIDIDDYDQSEKMMRIVEALDLKCRVYETTRGKHFLFMNNGVLDTCKTHTKLAIGLTVDIKLGCRNSYSILKYNGIKRKIIRDVAEDEEYDVVPKWMTPIKTNVDFVTLTAGDGRNQAFFNYILTLQAYGFTMDEARDCIRMINSFIIPDPLDNREIETILREEAFQKPTFYKGKEFQFDTFAKYLVSEHHIVKINGQLHLYKDGVYHDGYREIESVMIKHIPNLSQTRRREVLAYLDIYVMENTKTSDASHIAFNNGILDIDTDQFTGFSPEFVITNKIGHDYNPDAYSETVDKMLDKLAVGDRGIRMLLEEVVGYCFYRRNELRKSFILTGDKRNGKSTYLDMIVNILGDENTSALDLKELGDRFKTAELFGKLANIGDDIGDEFIANPAVFKKLVSGDRVNVERKGCDPFDFNNYAKMLFSANNIPRIKDKSGAVMDRLVIVPFDASFSPDDPDYNPNIKYELRQPECLEYMIRLGIEGLKRVIKNRRFTTSNRVIKEMKEYETTNNPVLLFADEISEDDVINQPTRSMYSRYSEFCLANNFQPMSNIEFSKWIKRRFGMDIAVRKLDGRSIRIFVKK